MSAYFCSAILTVKSISQFNGFIESVHHTGQSFSQFTGSIQTFSVFSCYYRCKTMYLRFQLTAVWTVSSSECICKVTATSFWVPRSPSWGHTKTSTHTDVAMFLQGLMYQYIQKLVFLRAWNKNVIQAKFHDVANFLYIRVWKQTCILTQPYSRSSYSTASVLFLNRFIKSSTGTHHSESQTKRSIKREEVTEANDSTNINPGAPPWQTSSQLPYLIP